MCLRWVATSTHEIREPQKKCANLRDRRGGDVRVVRGLCYQRGMHHHHHHHHAVLCCVLAGWLAGCASGDPLPKQRISLCVRKMFNAYFSYARYVVSHGQIQIRAIYTWPDARAAWMRRDNVADLMAFCVPPKTVYGLHNKLSVRSMKTGPTWWKTSK